jgi:hypothetical protein
VASGLAQTGATGVAVETNPRLIGHDQVQDSILDVNLLADLLPIEEFRDCRVLRGRFHNEILRRFRLNRYRAAQLSVDLHGDRYRVRGCIRFVPLWPFLEED